MGHEYKVGDRVRRSDDPRLHDLQGGDVAQILERVNSIVWHVKNETRGVCQNWAEEYFEPLDAPAAPAGLAGIRVTTDMIPHHAADLRTQQMQQAQAMRQHQMDVARQMYDRATGQQQGQDDWANHADQAAWDRRQQKQVFYGTQTASPVGDWVSGKEHAALKAELATLRSEIRRQASIKADALGDRDALRRRVAELETDVVFYRRECVRLGGKARGSR